MENYLKYLTKGFIIIKYIFIFIILLLIIYNGIYNFLYNSELSNFWLYFSLIRSIFAIFILVFFLYNFIKDLIYKIFNIKIHFYTLEYNLSLINKFHLEFIYFIEARNKLEEKFYPYYIKEFNKKKKHDVDLVIMTFVILYLIINIFFQEEYSHLKIFFDIFFSLFTIYLGILSYVDFKYIIPNLNKFIRTDSYLWPAGSDYGPGTYGQIRRTAFRTYTIASPVVKFCFTCIGGIAMSSWVYSEYFPESRTPAAKIGDRYNYYMHDIPIPKDKSQINNLPKSVPYNPNK